MAVIGQIRNRMGGLLVAVVGGALVIFVVSDFFDSGNKAFGGGDRSIGTIAGEEIDVQAFERRVDEQEEVYRSNGTTVDAQLQEQIRNNVWNEILRERTLLSRAKEAGFGELISREEFDDIRFGNNVWDAIYWGKDDQGHVVAHQTNNQWALMHLDLDRFGNGVQVDPNPDLALVEQIEKSLLAQ